MHGHRPAIQFPLAPTAVQGIAALAVIAAGAAMAVAVVEIRKGVGRFLLVRCLTAGVYFRPCFLSSDRRSWMLCARSFPGSGWFLRNKPYFSFIGSISSVFNPEAS